MCAWYVSHFEEAEDVISAAIGVIDIIFGIIIILSSSFDFAYNIFLIVVSFLYFLLGIRSLIKNFLKRCFFDWKGYGNIISSVLLILIYYGTASGFFKILGIIIVVKGLISVFLILMKQ